jgi:hypothetical protein
LTCPQAEKHTHKAGQFSTENPGQVSAKINTEIVDGVLSRAIDNLGPRLIRNGYDATTLAREFGAKPAEIRTFLAGTLEAERARELTDKMRAVGVPL